ncbi:hypothetical protein [Sorangium sp. So ce1000]|uniref:hypothetical protein n=1 Tax=Sorangium sp. So ce1000 TaxID=3133325 RepID=UPI003F6333EA
MSNEAGTRHGAPAQGASKSSTHSPAKGKSGHGGVKQIPPDVRLKIFSTADLIRIVGLGVNGVSDGQITFQAQTEYWRWANTLTFSSTLTFTSELIPSFTAPAIDAFLDAVSTSNQFTAPRNTAQGDWTQGTRTVPGTRTGYLYEMPNPDNNKVKMGVLFEKDNQTSALMAVAWYVQAQAPSNGLAFSDKIFTTTLTQVMGTNPNAIHVGTWYYILMGTP